MQWALWAADPCYRLERQVRERDATSKMGLRIKPHRAVALILQHLRFEVDAFDVAGSAGRKRDLTGGEGQREGERCGDNRLFI